MMGLPGLDLGHRYRIQVEERQRIAGGDEVLDQALLPVPQADETHSLMRLGTCTCLLERPAGVMRRGRSNGPNLTSPPIGLDSKTPIG